MKHRRRYIPEDFDFGVYAWQMPDGNVLGDGDGNMLNVPSMRGDLEKIAAIRNFVNKELHIFAGEPVFFAGVFRLTEEEHADQMEQMLSGLTPSLDLGARKDDMRRKKRNG